MSRGIPGNIPVAGESLDAVLTLGSPWMLRSRHQALVLVTHDSADPVIVWASPEMTTYRAVWAQAAAAGFVEPASNWGPQVDIDHVFPRSWAMLPSTNFAYVRLFPVWAEVNRQAGAGREKHGLQVGMIPTRRSGVIYAQELQVLKILGLDVGTVTNPATLYGAVR
jgi:hypothetical protein